MTEFMTMAGRTSGKRGAFIRRYGAVAWLVAALLAGVAWDGAVAQAPSAGNDGPVVYCRDPVRQIVTRSLARDCPPGSAVTEKEAEALKNEGVERRRRLMFGEKPEPVPALPVEPVREAPAERAAPPTPPPAALEPPRRAAAPPAPRPAEAMPAPAPSATAPEPAKPQAEAPPRAPERAAPPSPPAAVSEPAPPPPLAAEFREVQGLVAAMKPGEFLAVGKNKMRDVVPSLCNTDPRPFFCAVQGPLAIMSTWGGGAFDTRRNMLLITGGGHNDYAGNEVYHFRLDTLRWERVTDPSPLAPTGRNDGSFKVTDGTEAPVSFHSYDGLVYIPAIDRMFALPQASYQSGNTYDAFAYLYDPGTRSWKRGAKAPSAIGPDAGCDWWDRGGEVVCSTPNGLVAWKPATDAWRSIRSSDNQDRGRTLVVSQESRKSVQIWKQMSPLACFDLDGGQGRHACPVTGNTNFTRYAAPGIARAKDGRLAVWAGGNEVWGVDTAATPWTITRYGSQSGPTYRDLIGIYGKWQYVPALDVFIGVRWWDEQVWLYKLPPKGAPGDSADSTPKVLPSVVANALQDGQTVDLPKGTFADCIVVKANNVTIRGAGTTLVRSACEGGVATVITRGRNVTIDGLTVEDSAGDGATSCFGIMAGSATIRNVKTDRCPQNVRTGRGDVDVTIEDSQFGPTKYAGQLQHGAYFDKMRKVTLRRVTMTGCHSGGHVLKSRAQVTEVEDSVLAMGESNCSRIADFSEGGQNTIRRSVLQHGRYAQNADMICDGCEVGAFPDIPKPGKPGDFRMEDSIVISDWNGILQKREDGTQVVIPNIGPNTNPIIIARLGRGTVDGGKKAYFKNNRFVMTGGSPTRHMLTWPEEPPERYVDEGNQWLRSREAAGLKPYPALN